METSNAKNGTLMSVSSINIPETNVSKDNKGGSDEAEDARGGWSRGLEFLLSCLSISIGLGNVWRFPTLAYLNGGGAFLIPYFILLFLVAKPLYYLELSFGQFTGSGPTKGWGCVRGFKGIGYAQGITTFFLTVYYNYIMSICLFYMVQSMQSELPWTTCDAEWAKDENETCYDRNDLNTTGRNISSAELYFRNYVLQDSGGLDGISFLDWRLSLALLVDWTIVFLSVVKGVQSLGKVSYVTSTYPYVVLVSLLIVSLLREGATDGLKAFFVPDWEKLLDIEVWSRACEQSFYSLNTGFGHLVMYASYNSFRHNVGKDALIISVVDTFTSILAGTVVYSTLGNLAFDLKRDIQGVVSKADGLNLAFIIYPDSLGRIDTVPQLWSVLFFLMLYMLGLGSAVGHTEMILTVIKDDFPLLQRKKALAAGIVCSSCFLLGLTMCTNGGQYVMALFDNFAISQAVFIYAILEVVGIMWIYGWRRFCADIHFMLSSAVSIIWKVCWAFITPVTLIGIFLYGSTTAAMHPEEDKLKDYPWYGKMVAYLILAAALIPIPAFFIHAASKAPYSGLGKKILYSFKESDRWGPRLRSDREEWKEWKENGSPIINENEQNESVEKTIFKPTYSNPGYEEEETRF